MLSIFVIIHDWLPLPPSNKHHIFKYWFSTSAIALNPTPQAASVPSKIQKFHQIFLDLDRRLLLGSHVHPVLVHPRLHPLQFFHQCALQSTVTQHHASSCQPSPLISSKPRTASGSPTPRAASAPPATSLPPRNPNQSRCPTPHSRRLVAAAVPKSDPHSFQLFDSHAMLIAGSPSRYSTVQYPASGSKVGILVPT
jgi:hypothetical protein